MHSGDVMLDRSRATARRSRSCSSVICTLYFYTPQNTADVMHLHTYVDGVETVCDLRRTYITVLASSCACVS
jgi:hypothetical protein